MGTKHGTYFTPRRAGMTLVEVMMGFAVFAIAVVGTLGAIIFSLNNVDSARTEAQVAQILVNEMETLRLRNWLPAGIPESDTAVPPDLVLPDRNLVNCIRTLAESGPTTTPPAGLVANALEKYRIGGTFGVVPPIRETTFLPFSAYGAVPNSGRPMAQVGVDTSLYNKFAVPPDPAYTPRSVGGYTCSRYMGTFKSAATTDKRAAVVVLLVKWTDKRGDHSRALSTILVSNGLITQN